MHCSVCFVTTVTVTAASVGGQVKQRQKVDWSSFSFFVVVLFWREAGKGGGGFGQSERESVSGERERERERERENVCVCERERERDLQ